MMSIQEIARELRVSEKTVRRMLWRGELRGVRAGGQWRFPIENLANLLPSGVASPSRVSAPPHGASIHELIDIGGISPDRLSSKGFGFDNPVAPNDTEANMQKNRRTDIYIGKPNSDGESASTAAPADAEPVEE